MESVVVGEGGQNGMDCCYTGGVGMESVGAEKRAEAVEG